MRIFYTSLAVIFISGCSGSPGSSDIKKNLESAISFCPFLEIDNVKKTNGFANTDGTYKVAVSFDIIAKKSKELVAAKEKRDEFFSDYQLWEKEYSAMSDPVQQTEKEKYSIISGLRAQGKAAQNVWVEKISWAQVKRASQEQMREITDERDRTVAEYTDAIRVVESEIAQKKLALQQQAEARLQEYKNKWPSFPQAPSYPNPHKSCTNYKPDSPFGRKLYYQTREILNFDENQIFIQGGTVSMSYEMTMRKTENGWQFSDSL